MSKHTPTPWRVDGRQIIGTNDRGFEDVLAEMLKWSEPYTSTQQANAEHIVKCVNAHDELIGELQNFRCAFKSCVEAVGKMDEQMFVCLNKRYIASGELVEKYAGE